LTEIPGSSDVFEAGFVTYANDAKTNLLKVSDEVLETFGAVSVATAWAMAQGVLTKTNADTVVAITVWLDRHGGSEQKRSARSSLPERVERQIRRKSWPTSRTLATSGEAGYGFRRRFVPWSC
jgi:nicotinamide-nucleotide amidase